jgi:hypothetical protein
MFENMFRHTGQLNNTGKNVVVVYMQLPGDPDHALVIDTDALPDMYNEDLRRIVESVEAQQAKDLKDVLARRMTPDGSNVTMLNKFHQAGKLMKTPVNNVTMVPRRGVRWPLADVIAAMGSQEDLPLGFDDLDPETKAEVAANLKRFNVHAVNMDGEVAAGQAGQAASLIEMAKMLEADAQTKREQAYRIDPSLKPKNRAATVEQAIKSMQAQHEVMETQLVVTKTRGRPKKATKAAA